MKQALCVKSAEEFVNFIKGETDQLDLFMVPREICEKPEHGYLQLIPYQVIHAFDQETGHASFLRYSRVSSDASSEQRLAGRTSVGFGGHIDDFPEVLGITQTDVNPETYQIPAVNAKDLMTWVMNTATRELQEESNVDLAVSGIEANVAVRVFQGDLTVEVNQVHLCICVQTHVSTESINKFLTLAKADENEISKIENLTVHIGDIVATFCVDTVLDNLIEGLAKEERLEDWSGICIRNILAGIASEITTGIEYRELMLLRKFLANMTVEPSSELTPEGILPITDATDSALTGAVTHQGDPVSDKVAAEGEELVDELVDEVTTQLEESGLATAEQPTGEDVKNV